MPFGVVFAVLFLACIALGALSSPAATEQAAQILLRMSLLSSAVALALGLLLRRRWARWSSILLFALLLPFSLTERGGVESLATPLVALGSVVAGLLLLLPATGRFRATPTAGTPPARRIGRFVAAAAVLGLVGLLWGLAREGSRWSAPPSPVPRSAARSASFVDQRVVWSRFERGLELARSEGRPMLVNFVVDWCGYCRKMDRETWKHPSVVERMRDFVAVRVDAEEAPRGGGAGGADLAATFGVSGFPTLLLMDADGRVLSRTGGYQSPRQLLTWIERSLSESGRRSLARARGD
jgi:thiol:disulfide interchange protein